MGKIPFNFTRSWIMAMFGLFSSGDFVRVFRLEVLFCGMQDGTFLVENLIQNDRNAI